MSAMEKIKEVAAKASLKNRESQRNAAKACSESSFESDFNLVCEHNNFTELERMEALDLAKMDKVGARECFGAIAASLMRTDFSVGITSRIKTRIAAEASK